MMHKAWSGLEEVPCCFSMSSVKFQGHTAPKIVEFDQNWTFPDCKCSLNSPMAMKCCTTLETAKERCPVVFQGHPSNFKVTRDKTSQILTQIGLFRNKGSFQIPQICFVLRIMLTLCLNILISAPLSKADVLEVILSNANKTGSSVSYIWSAICLVMSWWCQEPEHYLFSHDDVIKWKNRVTGPLFGEFTGHRCIPLYRPVTRTFDVFIDLHLNKRLSKQSRHWWFERLRAH